MIYRTRKNTIQVLAGVTAIEALGPNPARKAIVLSPISPGSNVESALLVATFTPGVGQFWQVPARVTSVFDAYVFGAGGIAGAAGGGLGGGGGGGGAFANSGPQTVIAGQIWTIDVPAGGSLGLATVTNAAAVVIASAASGLNGLLDVAGVGGAGVTGVVKKSGGAGATATLFAGQGGGGGGGAGSFANGVAAAATIGGAGGGTVTQNGIGTGGNGGNGGNVGLPGTAGTTPGGGAGGAGDGDVTTALAGEGSVSIFYSAGIGGGLISMDPRSDVVAGFGTLNWISQIAFPLVITDDDIGSAITEPWFIVASQAAVAVQITEYMYAEPEDVLES